MKKVPKKLICKKSDPIVCFDNTHMHRLYLKQIKKYCSTFHSNNKEQHRNTLLEFEPQVLKNKSKTLERVNPMLSENIALLKKIVKNGLFTKENINTKNFNDIYYTLSAFESEIKRLIASGLPAQHVIPYTKLHFTFQDRVSQLKKEEEKLFNQKKSFWSFLSWNFLKKTSIRTSLGTGFSYLGSMLKRQIYRFFANPFLTRTRIKKSNSIEI